MRRLFHVAERHNVVLRALFILAVIAAIAILTFIPVTAVVAGPVGSIP